jgi:hypothetical protein
MSCEKQMIINRFHPRLPVDTLNIIKSFSFYDIETAAKLAAKHAAIKTWHNARMKRICQKFQYHTLSRATPYAFYEEDPIWHNEERWILLNHNTRNICVHMQGVNCRICGNYKQTYETDFAELPASIKCTCAHD